MCLGVDCLLKVKKLLHVTQATSKSGLSGLSDPITTSMHLGCGPTCR